MHRTRAFARLAAAALVAGLLAVGLVAAAAAADDASDERAFFDLVNAERTSRGYAPLQRDTAAANVARNWSAVMAGSQWLRHNPDLSSQVNSYVTTQWTRLGENVGYGGSVSALHNAFMASQGHRNNILGDYNRVGVGLVRDGSGRIWVTFVFIKGPPLAEAAAAPPVPEPTVDGRGAGVAMWQSGRTDFVVRGSDGSASARTVEAAGSTTGWYPLGGAMIGDPDAVSWGPDRLDIVIQGLDRAMWHRSWTPAGWSPWQSLGGGFSSGATIVSPAAGVLFVMGRGYDGAVWVKEHHNGAWGGWYTLGGALSSDPDAASPSTGRVTVVGRGVDLALWTRTFNGSTWSGWSSLGGQLTSSPTVASPSSGRLDVFARGTDQAIWSRTSTTGSSWSNWWSLGGHLVSSPDASGRNGRITIAARGVDNGLWVRSLGAGGWSNWYSMS